MHWTTFPMDLSRCWDYVSWPSCTALPKCGFVYHVDIPDSHMLSAVSRTAPVGLARLGWAGLGWDGMGWAGRERVGGWVGGGMGGQSVSIHLSMRTPA